MQILFQVLEKVLHYLEIAPLKLARGVCQDWAKMGANFLGKLVRITFSQPPNRANREELASFDLHLARNVKIEFLRDPSCSCIDACSCSTNMPKNFENILPHIHDKLETLEFSGVKASKPLQDIWTTYDFPRLTKISIIANINPGDRQAPPPQEIAQFRPLPSLKSFCLEMSPSNINSQSKAWMAAICDNLVKSASNLKKWTWIKIPIWT